MPITPALRVNKKLKSLNHSGSGPKEPGQGAPRDVPVSLRVPRETLEQVDRSVRRRRVRTPRHSWLLEAIYEKLDREAETQELREAEDELLAIREGRSRSYPLDELMRAHGNLEG